MTQPQPGWFPDPSDPSRQRYFDGNVWTEHYANFGGPVPNIGQPAKAGMSRGMKIGLAVGAVVLGLIGLGSIGNSDKSRPASSSSSNPDITNGVTNDPPAPKNNFTRSQENAIESAQSYLNYSGFSKKNLIRQLQTVEGFSPADATFAVEHIETSGGVDWNEQAVRSAKSYLDYSSFSLPNLIRQLEGVEGFTPEQAQYGANKAYAS